MKGKSYVACNGIFGDYSCTGWRTLASRIRERDGNRCRGCNRGEPDVSLEVHHRTYGGEGQCGECYLTGVDDDDLITLCAGISGCHEAITNVRRAARYAGRSIEVRLIDEPRSGTSTVRIKTEVTIEMAATPVAAGAVVRPKAFNPQGKELNHVQDADNPHRRGSAIPGAQRTNSRSAEQIRQGDEGDIR